MANPKIQLRHDTADNWASANPVLLAGEVGIETDTKKFKIGDGTTSYNNLEYNSTDINTNYPLEIQEVSPVVIQPPVVLDKTNKVASVPTLTNSVSTQGNVVTGTTNPNFYDSYGYVLLPYEINQTACLSATIGTASNKFADKDPKNIIFGKYSNGHFEPILFPVVASGSNIGMDVILDSTIVTTGTNSITYTDIEKVPFQEYKTNISNTYGDNNILLQIVKYTNDYRVNICLVNTELRQYKTTTTTAANRIGEINCIMLLPYKSGNNSRGTSDVPFELQKSKVVDGNMIFATTEDIFTDLTGSFEAYVENLENLIDIDKTNKALNLKYDNTTLKLNTENQLYVDNSNITTELNSLDARVEANEDSITTLTSTVATNTTDISSLNNKVITKFMLGGGVVERSLGYNIITEDNYAAAVLYKNVTVIYPNGIDESGNPQFLSEITTSVQQKDLSTYDSADCYIYKKQGYAIDTSAWGYEFVDDLTDTGDYSNPTVNKRYFFKKLNQWYIYTEENGFTAETIAFLGTYHHGSTTSKNFTKATPSLNDIYYNTAFGNNTEFSLPCSRYIELSIATTGSTYTAPANGYIIVYSNILASAINWLLLYNTNTNLRTGSFNDIGQPAAAYLPVRRGDKFKYDYRFDKSPSLHRMLFVYLEGDI